ncbi:MAG: uL15 family ribosomal protein [bacterium]
MQIHQLKRTHKRKAPKEIGRGGKRGKTSGRGTKGQKARSGRKLRPEIREVIKKIPKLRGYAFNSIQTKPIVVKLSQIEKAFKAGEEVTPKTLAEKGIVSTYKGRVSKIKILIGQTTEKVPSKITFKGVLVSKTAKEAIEKAGGSVS